MDTQHIKPINIIGIAVRTTNQNGQMGIDIPALWGRFIGENRAAQIPNKVDNVVYSIYTDYESDHTAPYTTILGCEVSSLNDIPDGMTGHTIIGGTYTKFTAQGNLMEGAVYNEWTRIWNTDLPRAYTSDFEVYNERSQDPTNAEVDIFIAIR